MNYFEKIEAYKKGILNEVEHQLFEEELAQNPLLQEEVTAYDLTKKLFDFLGETLPEETIINAETADTADLLINFTANKLSETEILANPPLTTNATIIREIKPQSRRTAWLVAASMLLILSLIGVQFYTSQSETNGLDTPVAVNEPIEKRVNTKPSNSMVLSETIALSKEPIAVVAPEIKLLPKSPEKVKKQLNIASKPVANLAKVPQDELSNLPKLSILKPVMVKLAAQEITTQKVIALGESVVYKGDDSVTLKPGFHAKAGANFVATTAKNANLLINEVIAEETRVIYEAQKTVTLKPGFHAKSGTDFIAKTKTTKALATDVIISPEEKVVFKAKKTIVFKSGFHAKAGAEVNAIVGE